MRLAAHLPMMVFCSRGRTSINGAHLRKGHGVGVAKVILRENRALGRLSHT